MVALLDRDVPLEQRCRGTGNLCQRCVAADFLSGTGGKGDWRVAGQWRITGIVPERGLVSARVPVLVAKGSSGVVRGSDRSPYRDDGRSVVRHRLEDQPGRIK